MTPFAIRLPIFVHRWITSLDFPVRSLKNFKDKYGISRFPRKMLPYVLKVSDRAGSECISRLRYIRYCLPYHPTTSAPWNIGISRLNTRPIRSPINASAMPLLPQPHDSGSVWFATPSLYESFIHYTFPVLTGTLWTSRISPHRNNTVNPLSFVYWQTVPIITRVVSSLNVESV